MRRANVWERGIQKVDHGGCKGPGGKKGEANGVSEERAKETEFKMKWGREAGPLHPGPVGHSQGCSSPTPSVKQSFLGEEAVSWKLSGDLSPLKRE